MSSPARRRPHPSCAAGLVAGSRELGDYTVVWARGEIDLATAPDLGQRLAEVIHAGSSRIIVDLTDVTFLDAACLNTLVGASSLARRAEGGVRLVDGRGFTRRLLRVTGLEAMFPTHPTVQESIAADVGARSGPAQP